MSAPTNKLSQNFTEHAMNINLLTNGVTIPEKSLFIFSVAQPKIIGSLTHNNDDDKFIIYY